MSTISTRNAGPKTSEFWVVIGSLLALGGIPGVDSPSIPEHMVWPTVAVACTYILARAITKLGGARGELFAAEPEPVAPPAPSVAQRVQTALEQAGKVVGGILLACVLLSGCKAFGDFMDQPLTQGPVTVVTEDGTEVTGQPVPPESQQASATLPDGSEVVLTTQKPASPTGWDLAAEIVGGVVGAATGQPALAILVGVAATALAGRRKKKAPAA